MSNNKVVVTRKHGGSEVTFQFPTSKFPPDFLEQIRSRKFCNACKFLPMTGFAGKNSWCPLSRLIATLQEHLFEDEYSEDENDCSDDENEEEEEEEDGGGQEED